MKRRLQPAPLTRMDAVTWAWVEWAESHGRGAIIGDISLETDRRDADLMMALRETRELCKRQGVLHCILAGHEWMMLPKL